ncbi:MAG: A/G-specific adenine glycosylase, partial [Chloroflexota bacterium]
MRTPLAKQILNWYSQNARELPWRGIDDPYAVWVSEIMLQQTRVDTVIPYFRRWMTAFPDIQSLATASQQEVLNLWEGLGYYRRARALHQAAKNLAAAYEGKLPQSVTELRNLPGIGPYTAAAIASIAFEADEAALDGNIRRVLARVFDISDPLGSKKSEDQLRSLSQEHLPSGQAGDFNQALMDLGAS